MQDRTATVATVRSRLRRSSPLAGTPLTGHARPASPHLAPLRTVPHLHGPGRTGTGTANPSVSAGLPGLRHLALSADQWAPGGHGRSATRTGGRPPGEDATLDGARARTARPGLDTGGALCVTGAFRG